ncbi:hypothetical protein ACOT81_17475 [Streptomyces sp. WI04-05B]|uniref:hypothetical protein n=1 Tax=Streptomyces TaxID=1883 RepID=UPI0029A60E37|nr:MULTISPECIES: hypothetical protein [unclassified Streptomyces]MDX2543747.1 hypothetical protein [Streptomyces sp. WI04-05B]MDX2582163.1 hypothetical protein [Streptomyces sp. WI04-05A]
MADNDGNDGIAWLGERWTSDCDDPLLAGQAGLVFAEGIAPQDLAVVFGAVPWEIPEPVSEEAKAVYDRTHPATQVSDEPQMAAYGREGRWSFLAGNFDFLIHFRRGFALPPGTGRVVLLYNISAKGMYCMLYFEDGQLVWSDEIYGYFDEETKRTGGHYFDYAPKMSFLNWAMHDAGCRPEVHYVDGRPVFADEGWIPDWKQRFLKGLEIAFDISVNQETFDAGGYRLAGFEWA